MTLTEVSSPTYEEPTALPELFQDTGLDLDPSIGYDEWARLGQNLQRFVKSDKWWLGDWLHFGEDKFGEQHAQALDLDLDQKTLANHRWVASRIPRRDRRTSLTWTHHRIAAELDRMSDRRRALKIADDEHLTTRQTQQLVDSLKPHEEPAEPEEKTSTRMTFTLSFSLYKADEKWGRIVADRIEDLVREELLTDRGLDDVTITSTVK